MKMQGSEKGNQKAVAKDYILDIWQIIWLDFRIMTKYIASEGCREGYIYELGTFHKGKKTRDLVMHENFLKGIENQQEPKK